MAIVIADDDPESVCMSDYVNKNKQPVPYHASDTVPLKPIFVLFKHSDGEFEPRIDAIEHMIRAIYHLRNGTSYV